MNQSAHLFVFAAAIPLLAASSPASANQLSAEQIEAIESAQENRAFATTSQTGDSMAGQLNTAARLLVKSSDSEAELTLSTKGRGGKSMSNQSFAVTVTAPISKETKRADFITDAGLPGKLSLSGSISISLVDLDDVKWHRGNIAALVMKSDQQCRLGLQGQDLTDEKIAEKCEEAVPFNNRKKFYLDSADQALLDKYRAGNLDILVSRPFWAFNLQGTVGTEKFEFFDSGTLASSSERRTSYSVGASIGFLPRLNSHWFGAVGFETKKSHKAAKAATYCPVGGPAPVKCTTGPFGPPQTETDHKLRGTVRYAGSLKTSPNGASPIGAELVAAYDFHDKTWGVELPVYLFVDKDSTLTGGIRGAYDSKQDDFQFGIFIGKSFDFRKP